MDKRFSNKYTQQKTHTWVVPASPPFSFTPHEASPWSRCVQRNTVNGSVKYEF